MSTCILIHPGWAVLAYLIGAFVGYMLGGIGQRGHDEGAMYRKYYGTYSKKSWRDHREVFGFPPGGEPRGG